MFYRDDILLNEQCDLQYAPEPYVIMKNGDTPLFILSSNPDTPMDLKQLNNMNGGSYLEFSNQLADFYLSDSPELEKNWSTKLQNSFDLTDRLGYNSVVNIMTVPFYSQNLNKEKLLALIRTSYSLFLYVCCLETFLFDKSVLIPVVINSDQEICLERISSNDWLLYQLDIINVKLIDLKMTVLTRDRDKVTSALFWTGDKRVLISYKSSDLT